MRTCFLLGRFEEAIESARALARQRMTPEQSGELVRTVVASHFHLQQWAAAERFIQTVAKRRLKLPELSHWLTAAQAGRRLVETAAAS
jgi:ferric-dicitrate binding protein FerR (iron transport regulator)